MKTDPIELENFRLSAWRYLLDIPTLKTDECNVFSGRHSYEDPSTQIRPMGGFRTSLAGLTVRSGQPTLIVKL